MAGVVRLEEAQVDQLQQRRVEFVPADPYDRLAAEFDDL